MSPEVLLQWFVSASTIATVELIARKRVEGWWMGTASQALWVALIVVTEQWGLLPVTLVLLWRYMAGLFRWAREEAVNG